MKCILPLVPALVIPLLCQNIANAQTTLAQLQASIGDVTDNRTTGQFNSGCTVEVKFTGDATMDARSVHRIHITEATDDTGHDLRLKDDDEPHNRGFSSSHSMASGLKGEIQLRNPARAATVIRLIKGEVELFNPTEANGGLLTISNVLSHPAEPIDNPVLTKNGVQLMYFTRDTYEARKQQLEAQETATADAAKEKLGDANPGKAFGQLFRGMMGTMLSNSKNAIQMYIHDPDKRIVSLKFFDAQGKPLKTRETWTSGDFQSTTLDIAPPLDAMAIIQLATPDAVKTFPLALENIPLP